MNAGARHDSAAGTPWDTAGGEPAPPTRSEGFSSDLNDAAPNPDRMPVPDAAQLRWELGFLATGLGHF